MLGKNIDRFGVQAVLRRDYLGAGEIMAMNVCDNIVSAYESRSRYRDKDGKDNWVEWARENPELSAILTHAEIAADGE